MLKVIEVGDVDGIICVTKTGYLEQTETKPCGGLFGPDVRFVGSGILRGYYVDEPPEQVQNKKLYFWREPDGWVPLPGVKSVDITWQEIAERDGWTGTNSPTRIGPWVSRRPCAKKNASVEPSLQDQITTAITELDMQLNTHLLLASTTAQSEHKRDVHKIIRLISQLIDLKIKQATSA